MAETRAMQLSCPPVVEARLLGRFAVTSGGRSTGAWPRPTARRLCQLVFVSPGRRITREAASEALFPSLSTDAAANRLYTPLSLARSALAQLGPPAEGLLCADRNCIWLADGLDLHVDLDAHERELRTALGTPPGHERDSALAKALLTEGVPLEDEPDAEWAAQVRERIAYLRQEARLELARDRSRGLGRAHPEEVLRAWQACTEADTSDEEAASALMRLHVAQGRRSQALALYERCAAALAGLGLKTSPHSKRYAPTRAELSR